MNSARLGLRGSILDLLRTAPPVSLPLIDAPCSHLTPLPDESRAGADVDVDVDVDVDATPAALILILISARILSAISDHLILVLRNIYTI